MIEVIHGVCYLICDRCQIEAEDEFDSFADAIEYKKENGWRSRRLDDGTWVDICPDCR